VTLQFGTVQDASIPNVGASGAIAGVLGGYLLILPRASVLTLFILGFFIFLREIPALFYLGIWIVFQAIEGGVSIVQPNSGGGIAFFAHIGGFVFGVLVGLVIRAVGRRAGPVAPAAVG
jgi:membrane associated rhomboid family serine protease